MNTIKELKLVPVWVNPEHLVVTALHVMRGHNAKCLGVLQEGRLIGMCVLEDLLVAPEHATVASVMRNVETTVESDTRIRNLAEVFVREQTEFLPVVENGKFAGIITPLMLLKDLGRSYDPLTRLSWSDALRNWGVENLKHGNEVTIIFIDLNDFGQYNKRFGHIVGDRVLQRVARFLQEMIDPDLDILVRYGGDEFAIGTLRDRADAEELSAELRQRMAGVFIGETEEPVSFSIGIFGGRRHKERENVHYAATLDNLINIASKNCMAEKAARVKVEAPTPVPVEEPPHEPEPEPSAPEPVTHAAVQAPAELDKHEGNNHLRLMGVYSDAPTEGGVVTVILSQGDSVVSGADAKAGRPPEESVAHATVKALERINPEVDIDIDAVELTEDSRGGKQVVIRGRSSSGGSDVAVNLTKAVKGDLLRSTAEATIEAFAGGLAKR